MKKSKQKKSKGELANGEPMDEDKPTGVAADGEAPAEPETEKKKKKKKHKLTEEQQEDGVATGVNGANGHVTERNGAANKKKKVQEESDGDVQMETEGKKKKKHKAKTEDNE